MPFLKKFFLHSGRSPSEIRLWVVCGRLWRGSNPTFISQHAFVSNISVAKEPASIIGAVQFRARWKLGREKWRCWSTYSTCLHVEDVEFERGDFGSAHCSFCLTNPRFFKHSHFNLQSPYVCPPSKEKCYKNVLRTGGIEIWKNCFKMKSARIRFFKINDKSYLQPQNMVWNGLVRRFPVACTFFY